MSKNTSNTLGSYIDQFIQNSLKEEQKIIALRHAIEEGVNSGLAEDFDPDEHLKMLRGKQTSKNIIFYRIMEDQSNEITRILHERMDLKNRLKE